MSPLFSFSSPQNQIGSGFHYFLYGWKLLAQRRFLPFIILPVAINALVMCMLIWFFFTHIGEWLEAMLPSWLDWLSALLIPLIFLMLLTLFYFAFTTLANFIAAPFNALLAEKVEQQLTGEWLAEMSMAELWQDLPRMLNREWKKMLYSIPRLVALFLLGFVPVLGQTVVPLLAFVFGAWLLAIQYCDYPFDNHKISFARMRSALSEKRMMNFTFGALVSLFTMIPFVNLVAMPVAVCGATAMWVSEYRDLFLDKQGNEWKTSDSHEIALKSTGGPIQPK